MEIILLRARAGWRLVRFPPLIRDGMPPRAGKRIYNRLFRVLRFARDFQSCEFLPIRFAKMEYFLIEASIVLSLDLYERSTVRL